jgi:hypothetical protein
MGKKGISKYDGAIKKNQQYNKWLVLDDKVVIEKEAKVLCKCLECNVTEKYLPILQLINGISKRCSVCGYSRKLNENPQWKGYKEIPFAWFSKYFLRKGRKKRIGSVKIEDIYELWIKQEKKCALSGIDISFNKDEKNGITASIDRIDSKREYHLENIQLVHKDINLMKNSFDQNYFLTICKKITQYNEKRLDTRVIC